MIKPAHDMHGLRAELQAASSNLGFTAFKSLFKEFKSDIRNLLSVAIQDTELKLSVHVWMFLCEIKLASDFRWSFVFSEVIEEQTWDRGVRHGRFSSICRIATMGKKNEDHEEPFFK